MEKVVYDKKKVYEGYFCYRVPKCLSSYVYLENFKAEHITLYSIIADFYNEEYGYAFPTVDTISLLYGKSNKTTSEHLRVLEKYSLLDIHKSEKGNNIYIPILPLEQDGLFTKYPKAKERYEKVVKAKEIERERSIQNLIKSKGYKY